MSKRTDDLVGLARNSKVLRGIASSANRYRIPSRIVAEEVESQIARLEPLLDKHNIKIIPAGPVPKTGKFRYGWFDAEKRAIYLHDGHGRVNYLEELHHLERAVKGDWLGINPPDDVIFDWEERFRILLGNLGVELF